MEDILLVTTEVANTVSTVSTESIIATSNEGNTITVGTEYSILVEVPRTSLVVTGIMGPPGPPGPSSISEDDTMYSKRVDFVSDIELYKGEADVGSPESSPVWRIRKITIDSDSDVTEVWASGNANFDKVWADRAALSYI